MTTRKKPIREYNEFMTRYGLKPNPNHKAGTGITNEVHFRQKHNDFVKILKRPYELAQNYILNSLHAAMPNGYSSSLKDEESNTEIKITVKFQPFYKHTKLQDKREALLIKNAGQSTEKIYKLYDEIEAIEEKLKTKISKPEKEALTRQKNAIEERLKNGDFSNIKKIIYLIDEKNQTIPNTFKIEKINPLPDSLTTGLVDLKTTNMQAEIKGKEIELTIFDCQLLNQFYKPAEMPFFIAAAKESNTVNKDFLNKLKSGIKEFYGSYKDLKPTKAQTELINDYLGYINQVMQETKTMEDFPKNIEECKAKYKKLIQEEKSKPTKRTTLENIYLNPVANKRSETLDKKLSNLTKKRKSTVLR